jgi:hypothetical protein
MRALRVMVTLAAGALAACGGDGGESPSAGEYRSAANRICADASRAEQALSVRAQAEGKPVVAYRGLVAIGVKKVRQLKELEPPEELREDHLRLVREFGNQNEILEKELVPRLDAGVKPQSAWVRAQVKAANANNGADFAARRAGLSECSLGDA